MSTMTQGSIMLGPTYAPSYRLTRRGRLAVLALALLAVLAVGILWSSGSVATERPGIPEPTETVMVSSGDTLWAIASEAADGGDVRAMVERIQQLNALDSGALSAGQRLAVPVD